MQVFKSLLIQIRDDISKMFNINKEQVGQVIDRAITPTTSAQNTLTTEILSKMIKPEIVIGLDVVATIPPSLNVNISPGYGSAQGKVHELQVQQNIAIDNQVGIYYVILDGTRVKVSATCGSGLPLAKIVIPEPGVTNKILNDKSDESSYDGYIVSGKDLLFNNDFMIDDDTIAALKNTLTKIFGEYIFGTIKANDSLNITNEQGTLNIDSNSMTFTNISGNELASYGAHEARIGNIKITPSTVQSRNFQAGVNGFQLKDDGNAEFNNITARGTIYATIGQIGGLTIEANSIHTSNYITNFSGFSLSSDGNTEFNNITARGTLSSPLFSSGYSGYGWKIDKDGSATFQNGLFRGEIRTANFVKDNVSVTNGDLIVTNGTALASGTTSSQAYIYTKEAVFSNNDITLIKTPEQAEYIMIMSGTSNYYWVNRDINKLYMYSPVYPPAQTDTYVKATGSIVSQPYYATDPTKPLMGATSDRYWYNSPSAATQRFHIDLGSTKTIQCIYYENWCYLGYNTENDAKNFTFWGSNNAADFADLVYSHDGTWTQIGGTYQFEQHVALDKADPKYILVSNTTAYRYYAFKLIDTWQVDSMYVGLNRLELRESRGISGAWQIGDVIASQGNRVAIVASGDITANLPYIDVIQRNSTSWNDSTTMTRLGNLTGITDVNFGNLSGYGLYTQNGYFIGSLKASNISGGTISGTASSIGTSARVVQTADNLIAYNASSSEVFRIDLTGGNSGDITIGNVADNKYLKWDDSTNLFSFIITSGTSTSKLSIGGNDIYNKYPLSIIDSNIQFKNNANAQVGAIGKIGAGTGLDINANNSISLYTGSSERVNISSTIFTVNTDMSLPTAKKLFFDGGSDTYIYEESANLLTLITGTTATLRVRLGAAGTYAATLVNGANSTTGYGLEIFAGDNGAGTAAYFAIFNRPDSTNCGYIVKNGANAVAYVTTSDARMKENIKDTKFGLADLLKLKVRDFSFKGFADDKHTGLVAQEVLPIYKEAVSVPTDSNKMMGIDYGKFTPLLVKAIQEQNVIINDLKKRIEKLEAK